MGSVGFKTGSFKTGLSQSFVVNRDLSLAI